MPATIPRYCRHQKDTTLKQTLGGEAEAASAPPQAGPAQPAPPRTHPHLSGTDLPGVLTPGEVQAALP